MAIGWVLSLPAGVVSSPETRSQIPAKMIRKKRDFRDRTILDACKLCIGQHCVIWDHGMSKLFQKYRLSHTDLMTSYQHAILCCESIVQFVEPVIQFVKFVKM